MADASRPGSGAVDGPEQEKRVARHAKRRRVGRFASPPTTRFAVVGETNGDWSSTLLAVLVLLFYVTVPAIRSASVQGHLV